MRTPRASSTVFSLVLALAIGCGRENTNFVETSGNNTPASSDVAGATQTGGAADGVGGVANGVSDGAFGGADGVGGAGNSSSTISSIVKGIVSSNGNGACDVSSQILKDAQQIQFSWTYASNPSAVKFKLSTDDVSYSGDLGSIIKLDNDAALYTAPSKITKSIKIFAGVILEDGTDLNVNCSVNLIAASDIGIEDDGSVQGLVGNVYSLPVNTPLLPNFDLMTPLSIIVAPNLDVPNRAFDTGFPGVPDLVEWFGIKFTAKIYVPAACDCEFKMTSDDGSNLYVDGVRIIDNDGTHAVATKTGTVHLAAGFHDFRVDYFQGPRWYIALQLFWRQNASDAFTVIDSSSFTRPTP